MQAQFLRAVCFVLLAFYLLTPATLAQGNEKPKFPEEERWLIESAFRIVDRSRDMVWKDFGKTPFAVLLVAQEHEFLIRHPAPPADFEPLQKKDLWLRSDVFFRKRVFDTGLRAAFPVNGVPTVVMGLANAKNVRDRARWVLTLIHEHFHQLQDSKKNAFAEYAALGLARGDTTGMWMLNYPFPYADSEVDARFAAMCAALAEALSVDERKQKKEFRAKVIAYLKARAQFRAGLTEDDYKYFSFQVWREGVARHTEIEVGIDNVLWGGLEAGLRSMAGIWWWRTEDYQSIGTAAKEMWRDVEFELPKLSPKDRQRVAFYSFGAGEAELLDRVSRGWHGQYFKKKFFLEEYYPKWAKQGALK